MEDPEPLDPELERLAAWFVQNRKQIAVTLDQDEVISLDEGIIGIKKKVNNRGEVEEKVRVLVRG